MKTKVSDKLDTKSTERPTYKALEQEVMEQARLNGMGSEREARLMASVTELERENAALRKRLELLSKDDCKQTDEYFCVDREHGLWKRKNPKDEDVNADRLALALALETIDELERENAALRKIVDDAFKLIEHANPNAWANGNIHPDGFGPDEGEVMASRYYSSLLDALAAIDAARKEQP